MKSKTTASDRILQVLLKTSKVAVHEFDYRYFNPNVGEHIGSSQPAISARLREMAHGYDYDGKRYFVEGVTRPGTAVKEWSISRIEDVPTEPKPEPIPAANQLALV